MFIGIGLIGGLLLSGIIVFILIKNDVIFLESPSDYEVYNVYFDSDGGTDVDYISIVCGEVLKLPEEPVKDGYEFSHWINKDDNSIIPKDSFAPCKDVELKAVWKPKEVNNNNTSKEINYITISVDEYLNIMKKSEKSIIYIARPTCSWCQKQLPILKKLMNQYDLKVYYLNTENFYDSDKQDYTEEGYKLINSSEKYKDGFGTPNTIIVQNGTIIDGEFGYVEEGELKELLLRNKFIQK